jgi:hypothetical protein
MQQQGSHAASAAAHRRRRESHTSSERRILDRRFIDDIYTVGEAVNAAFDQQVAPSED